MKKIKKGSSFILVIFLTAVIFIIGTTMLLVVTTDYKSRVNQSKRLQNLYSADSCINLAYNVATKEAELAVLCANNRSYFVLTSDREYFQNDGIVDEEVYRKLNKVFKNYFIKALLNGYEMEATIPRLSEGDICDSIESLAYREVDEEEMLNLANNNYDRYIDYIENIQSLYQLERIDTPLVDINDANGKETSIRAEIVESHYYNGEELGQGDLSEGFSQYDGEYYITIKVTSTFRDEVTASGQLNNTKTISTKFKIKAPEYEQSLYAEKLTDTYYSYPFLKAISADGNLNIETDNTYGVKISGDVWVGGIGNSSYDEEQEYIDNKYTKGVMVDSGMLEVSGNIYTDGTVALNKNAVVNVSNNGESYGGGDIYSLNLYLGPKTNGDGDSSNNQLICDRLITNNDLTMNSSNSIVELEEYYGISDVEFNGAEIKVNNNDSIKKAAKSSSSIIVNTVDDSNLISINKAYVNGVAFIDVDRDVKYETGESIAVDGNYLAYLDRIPGYGNVTFERYSSYNLLSGNVDVKKKYFSDYYNQNRSLITEGGIEINELNAIGAYVYKKNNNLVVYDSNNDSTNIEDLNSTVNDKKIRYANNVYLMGHNNEENLSDVYAEGELKSTVAIGNNSLVKFEENEEIICSKSSLLEFTNYNFMYNPYKEYTVFVDNNGIYLKDDNGEIINQLSNSNINYCRAVIITKGDVIIDNLSEDGTILQYYGSIISGGNVNINTNKVSINYYEDNQIDKAALTITEILNSRAGKKLENVLTEGYNPREIVIGTSIAADYQIRRGYNAVKYLQKGLWRVEK